jgi:hypothetical protein
MKAFPQKYPINASAPHHEDYNPVERGMELRDYFAGIAMQVIMSRDDFEFEDDAWENAYDAADAMMEAREK